MWPLGLIALFDSIRRIVRVPAVAQWKWIWPASMRTWVQSLALLSGLRIWHCHELWYRSQVWLVSCVLLWLWCRLAALAPIGPLAWEPPYTAGVALKRQKEKRKKEKRELSCEDKKKKKKCGSWPSLIAAEGKQKQMGGICRTAHSSNIQRDPVVRCFLRK